MKTDVKAAYDPMELTSEDLAHAEGELRKVIQQLKDYPADKEQDEVYREFRFDLCATCQKIYLKSPLGD